VGAEDEVVEGVRRAVNHHWVWARTACLLLEGGSSRQDIATRRSLNMITALSCSALWPYGKPWVRYQEGRNVQDFGPC
jgi:hypothetical protein